MEEIKKAKVIKSGNSFAIRIPFKIAREFHLSEGEEMNLVLRDRTLFIQKAMASKEDILRDAVTMLNEYLTDEE